MRPGLYPQLGRLLPLLCLAGLLASGPLHAGDRGWIADEPSLQMDQDPTMVPVGRGAIFVPAMSDPEQEPLFIVYRGEERVGSGETGKRFIVPPGDYRIEVGSGVSQDRFSKEVTVVEGRTALIKVEWAGLRIQVVDQNSIPFRGSYELIAFPSARNLGIGYGAAAERGERLRTWILEPGLYMIIKTGSTYQSRTNFYTFRLSRGYLDTITLVMDQTTGDFLGAGHQIGISSDWKGQHNLTLTATFGGGLSFTSQKDVYGSSDSTIFSPSLYSDAIMQWLPGRHIVYSQMVLDEIFMQKDWGRLEKTGDVFRLNALYAYRLTQTFGPYVRSGVESTLFPGYIYFDGPTNVYELASDGSPLRAWKNQDVFKTSRAFYPLTLKGGVGLRLNTPPLSWLNVWGLIGVGGRLEYSGNTYRDTSSGAKTPEPSKGESVQYVSKVYDETLYGMELSVVGQSNLGRFITLTSEFEYFNPFKEFDPLNRNFGKPDVRFDTNIGLRLISYVSLNYMYRLIYAPKYSDLMQHDQRAMLRFSYTFF